MDTDTTTHKISAYDQAIKYISMRSHTAFELKTKLGRKKYQQNEIAEAILTLTQRKYIDDYAFAQLFAQNLIKYKTFGYYGIKNKLRMRGIDDETAKNVLEEELSTEQELKIAEKAINKSGKKEYEKLAMMLQRKGFRSEAISKATKSFR